MFKRTLLPPHLATFAKDPPLNEEIEDMVSFEKDMKLRDTSQRLMTFGDRSKHFAKVGLLQVTIRYTFTTNFSLSLISV